MDAVLTGLRAAAEPTRLRLLALCARAELTVSDLTQILGQSQPRVSRHLKLLCEAGLVERSREGTWAFYALARSGPGAELGRLVVDLVGGDDQAAGGGASLDMARLAAVKQARAEAAAAYFRANAARWDRIRALHVDEAEVERVLLDLVPEGTVRDLLDIGTGTGRILEIFAGRIDSGLGIDLSREMLALARARLERADLRNCRVRQADMYKLPWAGECFDAVTIHQVLHFAESPAQVIREAVRVLRPGGRVVVVDFAPHDLKYLRDQHAHRRLGFGDDEVTGWFRDAGVAPAEVIHLPGEPLTVSVWPGAQPPRPGRAAARRGRRPTPNQGAGTSNQGRASS